MTPFLTLYQTDTPIHPFICGDLHDLVRDLLAIFIQKSVLDIADTVTKVLRLDPTDHKQHVASSKVVIDFAAEKLLLKLHKRAKQIIERDYLPVQLDTKRCLIAMTEKILE